VVTPAGHDDEVADEPEDETDAQTDDTDHQMIERRD
jgi:hypothetical protein